MLKTDLPTRRFTYFRAFLNPLKPVKDRRATRTAELRLKDFLERREANMLSKFEKSQTERDFEVNKIPGSVKLSSFWSLLGD